MIWLSHFGELENGGVRPYVRIHPGARAGCPTCNTKGMTMTTTTAMSPYSPDKTSYATGTMPDLLAAQADINRRVDLARRDYERLQALKALSTGIKDALAKAEGLCEPGVTSLEYASAQADLISVLFGIDPNLSRATLVSVLRQETAIDPALETLVIENRETAETADEGEAS